MTPEYLTYLALGPSQQREVQIWLCERALPVWEGYFAERGEVVYYDSVVGTRQVLDKTLPRQALEAVKSGRDHAGIEKRYYEPIVALQDDDLEWPDSIEFAYYAIYNAFSHYVEGRTLDTWIIVNQALTALGPDQAQDSLQAALDAISGS